MQIITDFLNTNFNKSGKPVATKKNGKLVQERWLLVVGGYLIMNII